jgi:hypothetical protein
MSQGKKMLDLKIQQKWQFQLGLAILVIPFLYQFYDISKSFKTIVVGGKAEELIANNFNIFYCIIPIQIIGIILIILTVCGFFEKKKNFNKKHNK